MFSERLGIRPSEMLVQYESMDNALRNSLWTVLTSFYWENFNLPMKIQYELGRHDIIRKSNLSDIFTSFWIDYSKQPIDTIPTYFYEANGGLNYFREFYFKADWYEIFDFIELVASSGPSGYKAHFIDCLLYTSPSPRDLSTSRMPSSA